MLSQVPTDMFFTHINRLSLLQRLLLVILVHVWAERSPSPFLGFRRSIRSPPLLCLITGLLSLLPVWHFTFSVSCLSLVLQYDSIDNVCDHRCLYVHVFMCLGPTPVHQILTHVIKNIVSVVKYLPYYMFLYVVWHHTDV